MDYSQLAKAIVEKVGGKDNITGLTHCVTRLRFNLADEAKADTEGLKKMEGVIGVIQKGGQYQVVVGNDVKFIYQAVMKNEKLDFDGVQPASVGEENRSVIAKVLDTISGIFVPIVPMLAGAGMLKALLSVLVLAKLVDPASQTFVIFNFMGDAGFYFLPVILAASAARKFNVNPYIAMAIGGILLHPNFTGMVAGAREAGTSIAVFGMPVRLSTYGNSVVPIILAIWFMSYVEPFVDRVIPKSLRMVLAPLFTMLIVGLATLVVLGPLGNYLGEGVGILLAYLNTYASWLVPMLVGAFTPLMVMTGMHYGLIPIGINMLASSGYDTVAGPGMTVSNIAQGGASLAVAFKTKDADVKRLASSVWLTAVLGVTEPALYGINLRYKRPLISAMIGGGAAGLFIGIFGVRRFAQVAPGLLALPAFIGPEGLANFYYAVIGCVIAFVVSFLVQYVWGLEEEVPAVETGIEPALSGDETITAPLSGTVIKLSDVADEVFASGMMGSGAAIIPSEGKVYAPADATVTVLLDTKHAIGLRTDAGAEILIHVGMDTVELGGKHFETHVAKDQHVTKGTLLLSFDAEEIKAAGYDITTPIVVTNAAEYPEFVQEDDGTVTAGAAFLTLKK